MTDLTVFSLQGVPDRMTDIQMKMIPIIMYYFYCYHNQNGHFNCIINYNGGDKFDKE